MNRTRHPLALLLGLVAATALGALTASPARAQDASTTTDTLFYFYSYAAPEGAATLEGAGTEALYLFWGMDGKKLAALGAGDDITLERDGQVIVGPFRFGDVKAAPDIAALYAPSSQSRRLAATLTALDNAFTGDATVTAATFAQRLWAVLAHQGTSCGTSHIQSCVETEKAFGDMLARSDANVAIATYSAARLPLPTTVATFRLKATNGTATRVLGELTVDPQTMRVAPGAPTELVDVSAEQQRCDVPSQKEQGNLALSWADPAVSPAVAPIPRHNLAGYEVFAKSGPCTSADPVDLASLARAVPHDTHGGFALPGFVRLNETLVAGADLPPLGPDGRRVSADPIRKFQVPGQAVKPGWLPTFAQLRVPASKLGPLGFDPGTPMCVYVAAVDRAGQLGKTAALAARVADFSKPPAPWDVDADPESARTWDEAQGKYIDSDTLTLSWRQMNVQSWVARDDSIACNPIDAAASGRLLSATKPQDCELAENRTETYLAIDKYLVYRFENEDEARGFVDTDGDGFADSAESTDPATGPGTACDSAKTGTDAKKYHLVDALPTTKAAVGADGAARLQWVDPAPVKGQVVWYLIAAQGKNGWVGAPSAPVRGFYPDTSAPARPDLNQITWGTCGNEVVSTDLFSGPPVYAVDDSDDAVAKNGRLRLYCLESRKLIDDPALRLVDGYVGEAAFVTDKGGTYVSTAMADGDALYDAMTARYFSSSCTVYAEVIDANGRVVAKSDPNVDLVTGYDGRMLQLAILLQSSCTTAAPEPIKPGQIVDGKIHIGLPAGTCADFSYEDGGTLYRLMTICGPQPVTFTPPDVGGDLLCYALTVKGNNQVPGLPLSLPCVKTKTSIAPQPPLLVALSLPADTTEGQLSWRPASPDGVAGIVVEVTESTLGVFRSEFFPVGATSEKGTFLGTFDLTHILPPGGSEHWCLRARSLSSASTSDNGGLMSDWVGPICGSRVTPGTPLPSYLPWPSTSAPPVHATALEAGYLGRDGLPYVLLGTFDPKAAWPDPDLDETPDAQCGVCGREDLPTCYTDMPVGSGAGCADPARGARSYCIEMCQLLIGAAGDFQRVIGYRQTYDAANDTWGEWLQVTPYLERPFCMVDKFLSNYSEPPRCADIGPNEVTAFGLVDASFIAARFGADTDTPSEAMRYAVAFVDRYPHEPGTKIRYQFVRFGPEGQIAEVLPTTAIDIPAEEAP